MVTVYHNMGPIDQTLMFGSFFQIANSLSSLCIESSFNDSVVYPVKTIKNVLICTHNKCQSEETPSPVPMLTRVRCLQPDWTARGSEGGSG